MLIWSLLSIFGLWIAHRTIFEAEKLQIVLPEQLIQIRVFSFLTVLVLNFLLRDRFGLLFAVNVLISTLPLWAPSVIEKRRESSLRREFTPILDQLILSMKSGKGFRASFAGCLERHPRHIRYVLNEFLSALQYQKDIKKLSRDQKIQFFFHELAMVEQSQHKPVDRLKALRRRLLIEKNFRQKSRQALIQVRFQSWVISGMYLLVLVYLQHDFGIHRHLLLVSVSAALFLSGLFWVQRMGRSYQWKI